MYKKDCIYLSEVELEKNDGAPGTIFESKTVYKYPKCNHEFHRDEIFNCENCKEHKQKSETESGA
ncbi:MAG: hypothetical protein WC536_00635 [Patescibacteria group bacterium]